MSDTNNPAPSVLRRTRFRTWLRNHPTYDAAWNVAGMTMPQLTAKITELGGNPLQVENDSSFGLAIGQDAFNAAPVVPIVQSETSSAPDKSAWFDKIEALRTSILDHGFASVRQEIAQLIEAAHKPAEVQIVQVEKIVEVAAATPVPAGMHVPSKVSTETWSDLFGLDASTYGKQHITVWDHPAAPKSNPLYVFPQAETALALAQLARSAMSRSKGGPGKHIALIGPAGTGKSSWGREFAARTGRPCVILPMNDGLELEQLLGQTVLDGQGGTVWQDGALLAAIRQPQAVIVLDEVGGMRPAVGVALNSLLQEMAIVVPDTGERVAVAQGVVFVATNNTRLMDSGTTGGGGYAGVQRQNRAFADRFGCQIEIGYQDQATERDLLVGYTGSTPELATMLVDVATLSRSKAETGEVTHGLGFRRLLAWTEALMDGADTELAFKSTVLNASPDADQEALRQIALVALDATQVRRAIAGKPARAASSASASRAAADFA